MVSSYPALVVERRGFDGRVDGFNRQKIKSRIGWRRMIRLESSRGDNRSLGIGLRRVGSSRLRREGIIYTYVFFPFLPFYVLPLSINGHIGNFGNCDCQELSSTFSDQS